MLELFPTILAEGKWPRYQSLDDGWGDKLWSSNVKRQEMDAEILKCLGFKEILVVANLNKKLLTMK